MMVKGRIEMTEKGDVQLCSGKHLKSVGLLRRLSPLQRGWENVFSKNGRKGEMSGEWSERRSVVSNSMWPNGLYSPWNSPGRNTGMGSHLLLQEIFPTLGLNPGLPHCSRILYQLPGSQDKWVSQIKKEYVGRLILKTTPAPGPNITFAGLEAFSSRRSMGLQTWERGGVLSGEKQKDVYTFL